MQLASASVPCLEIEIMEESVVSAVGGEVGGFMSSVQLCYCSETGSIDQVRTGLLASAYEDTSF